MNNYLAVFQAILKNKNIESHSLNMNPGLPLKGIPFSYPHAKKMSIIPCDINKDKEKVFKKKKLIQLLKFH